MSHVSSWYSAY